MIGAFRPTEARPDEQVGHAIIPVVLGGQGWSLSVLPIRANREWTALFAQSLQAAALVHCYMPARVIEHHERLITRRCR